MRKKGERMSLAKKGRVNVLIMTNSALFMLLYKYFILNVPNSYTSNLPILQLA